jgi:hypothetical protein
MYYSKQAPNIVNTLKFILEFGYTEAGMGGRLRP